MRLYVSQAAYLICHINRITDYLCYRITLGHLFRLLQIIIPDKLCTEACAAAQEPPGKLYFPLHWIRFALCVRIWDTNG